MRRRENIHHGDTEELRPDRGGSVFGRSLVPLLKTRDFGMTPKG
jgi:hypothetical protein